MNTVLSTLPTFLYRLFDADDVLLYVGITDNLRTRLTHHARKQSWWSLVARVQHEAIADRGAAEAAERDAILHEKPLMNKMHVPAPTHPTARRPLLLGSYREELGKLAERYGGTLQVIEEKDLVILRTGRGGTFISCLNMGPREEHALHSAEDACRNVIQRLAS